MLSQQLRPCDVDGFFEEEPSMTGRERGIASHLIAEQSTPSTASVIKLSGEMKAKLHRESKQIRGAIQIHAKS